MSERIRLRCETTTGTYRCLSESGHSGPCEAQAPEYDARADMRWLRKRIEVLEAQVQSLQMSAPRGIPR